MGEHLCNEQPQIKSGMSKSRRSTGNSLMIPSKSGRSSYRSKSGRSRTGSVSQSYISKMRSGMSGRSSMRSGRSSNMFQSTNWTPSGRSIQVDENQMAHMEKTIRDLEAKVEQLQNIPIKDVLNFLIKNSNTAHVTIGKEVCPPGHTF